MHNPSPFPSTPFDTRMGALLLANMLADWRESERDLLRPAEASDEPQDHSSPPQQIGLRLPTPVDAGPSASPSREHGAAVRAAREGPGTGLERSCDPHPGRRSGHVRFSDGGEGR